MAQKLLNSKNKNDASSQNFTRKSSIKGILYSLIFEILKILIWFQFFQAPQQPPTPSTATAINKNKQSDDDLKL